MNRPVVYLEKFDSSQARDENGRWTDGAGGGAGANTDEKKPSGAGDKPVSGKGIGPVTVDPKTGMLVDENKQPIIVFTVEEALERVKNGEGVMFERPDQVVTMLDKIADIVADAKAKGQDAPMYDLCKVSLANSNLFCSDSMQIERDLMPQLSGKPTAGSPADKNVPKNKWGGVDLTEPFREHLEKNGVKVEKTTVDASRMRATQNQLDGRKVAQFVRDYEKNGIPKDPIIVSEENYIVDGHHRWAAEVGLRLKTGKTVDVPVYRVNMKILPLIEESVKYSVDMGVKPRALGKSARSFRVHCKGIDCSVR